MICNGSAYDLRFAFLFFSGMRGGGFLSSFHPTHRQQKSNNRIVWVLFGASFVCHCVHVCLVCVSGGLKGFAGKHTRRASCAPKDLSLEALENLPKKLCVF